MKRSLGGKPLAVPTPAWVIGTYAEDGKPNVMTAAWGGICCSKPPCLSVSLRSATMSHGNIMRRKAFTVNVGRADQIKDIDYFGTVSGRDADKLAVVGMHAAACQAVDAPMVEEFPLVVACKVIEVHELGLHTQFVGEIMDVLIDEDCLDSEGRPDFTRIKPPVFDTMGRSYWALGEPLGPAFNIGLRK